MPQRITSDLAALCWANPFSEQRGVIEKRLLGDAYRPVPQTGGGGVFSPNLSHILSQCSQALKKGNTFPEYPELVAFEIYHQLGHQFDDLIENSAKTSGVWRNYLKQWNQFFPADQPQPKEYDQETLF